MTLDLRHLRALVAVFEEGTFTDAGILLGVSQASVSRSIAALEQHLEVKLLRRTTHAVNPTAAGIEVVERARRILLEVSQLEDAARSEETVLRVGYAWAALGQHTTAAQRRWSATQPKTRLDLVHTNTSTAGLVEGLADVAIVRRPLTDPRFVTQLIGTEQRVAAMSASGRAAIT